MFRAIPPPFILGLQKWFCIEQEVLLLKISTNIHFFFFLQCPKRQELIPVQLGYSWTSISLNVISIFHILPSGFCIRKPLGQILARMCAGCVVKEYQTKREKEDSGLSLTFYLQALEPGATYFIFEFVYTSAEQG